MYVEATSVGRGVSLSLGTLRAGAVSTGKQGFGARERRENCYSATCARCGPWLICCRAQRVRMAEAKLNRPEIRRDSPPQPIWQWTSCLRVCYAGGSSTEPALASKSVAFASDLSARAALFSVLVAKDGFSGCAFWHADDYAVRLAEPPYLRTSWCPWTRRRTLTTSQRIIAPAAIGRNGQSTTLSTSALRRMSSARFLWTASRCEGPPRVAGLKFISLFGACWQLRSPTGLIGPLGQS